MPYPGHRHDGLLRDVSLETFFRIGKEEGFTDEYIHAIWNYRLDFTPESQGWCEHCFRKSFSKYASEFEAARKRAGLSL